MSPATSKKQWRLIKAIADGTAKETHGMTRQQAKEYISKQPTPKGLPETAPNTKKKKNT